MARFRVFQAFGNDPFEYRPTKSFGTMPLARLVPPLVLALVFAIVVAISFQHHRPATAVTTSNPDHFVGKGGHMGLPPTVDAGEGSGETP
jgi:hypothetical protein